MSGHVVDDEKRALKPGRKTTETVDQAVFRLQRSTLQLIAKRLAHAKNYVI